MNLILINLHNARDKLIYGLESVTYAVSIAGLFKLLKKKYDKFIFCTLYPKS
jgi:hypothetical protein